MPVIMVSQRHARDNGFSRIKKAPKSGMPVIMVSQRYARDNCFSKKTLQSYAKKAPKSCFSTKKSFFRRIFFLQKKLPNHVFRRKNHFSDVFISNKFFFRGPEWILRQGTQYYVLKNVYRENRFFVKKMAWKAPKSHFSTKKSLFRRFYFKQNFFSTSWVNFTPRDTVLRFKKCLSRKSIFGVLFQAKLMKSAWKKTFFG